MKVLQINGVYRNGSTGSIVHNLMLIQEMNDIKPYAACGNSPYHGGNVYSMQSKLGLKLSVLQTRIFGKHGFYNITSTRRLINWIEKIDPDIIHLQNLHGHYLNIKILFDYLKSAKKPVIWTLHDCWAFTGHCAHFELIGCEKWLTGCYKCPQLRSYPQSLLFDRSKSVWETKRELFTELCNFYIVTPSIWLSDIVKKSFLGAYPVFVINNGIDTDVFRPIESSLRDSFGLQDCFIILGMAGKWSLKENSEVVDYLLENCDSDMRIVLIGEFNFQDDRIIPVPYIKDQKTLAEYYSFADVFVNLTLEDTFPTVNLESLACGTPVITYRTGGSTECVDNSTGFVVSKLDKMGLFEAIRKVKNKGRKSFVNNCVSLAKGKYNKNIQFAKYIDLYNDILNEKAIQ